MNLRRSEEEKIRRALGLFVDATPAGGDFAEINGSRLGSAARTSPGRTRVAIGAFAAVVALIGPVALWLSWDRAQPSRALDPTRATALPVPSTPATDVPIGVSTGAPAVIDDAVLDFDGFVVVRRVPATGDLVGLRDRSVWVSSDEGLTWESLLALDHDVEVLGLAVDGTVIAVRNPNELRRGVFGEGSVSNDTPEVHRYDPVTEEWQITVLPRPDLPAPDFEADSESCPLGGVQSWVDAVAMATGNETVIVGDHHVVFEGICDEIFQFVWTSLDGIEWSVVPQTGIDGYVAGILWAGEQYVAYGAETQWHVSDRRPHVWTSTNLATWTAHPLDLSALPDGSQVIIAPATAGDYAGGGFGKVIRHASGAISLSFPVELHPPGLNAATITDIESLRNWLEASDQLGSPAEPIDLGELLARLDIDFPLDDGEIRDLGSYFNRGEIDGFLLLESTDGTDWSATYQEP